MIAPGYYQKIINKCPIPQHLLKKFGIAGFIFFTVKGLAWLAVIAYVAFF